MKTIPFISFFAALLLVSCAPFEAQFKSSVPVTARSVTKTVPVAKPPEAQNELPDEINLDVPFFPQAPDGDWSLPWQEACEEASIILGYYYSTDKPLSKEQFKSDLLALVDWQKENFGDYIHTTVDQTAQMLEEYFGFENFSILNNPGIEDLKKELADGHVIVAPFAGRMLGNPYYSGEGPYYHMLVIKGYDGKNFITGDVGTKRGQNFIYSYQTIMNALHDYKADDIVRGTKKVIVFE